MSDSPLIPELQELNDADLASLLKRLIMRARAADVGIVTDEEAEFLITNLDLRGA